MVEQSTLEEYQADSYSLAGLRRRKEKVTLEDADITFGVAGDTLSGFGHSWTFDDIQTIEEFNQELERTREAAVNRLNSLNNDPVSMNETDLQVEDIDPAIDDFREDKKNIQQVINKTVKVYDRSDDRGRNISISNKMNKESENLADYQENLSKVEQNLDFEENLDVGTEEDVFEEDRQRTTGDLTWVNEDGQEVFTQVTSVGVVYQIGGPGGIRVEFDDKEKAKQYYEDNRYA